MVKHHISYKNNIVEELSPSEHFSCHRDRCAVCGGSGVNLLRAKFDLNPKIIRVNIKGITYINKQGKICKSAGWKNLCRDCWKKALLIEGLIVERLHKNTWDRVMDMYGSEQERRDFVYEYIKRYPARERMITAEEWRKVRENFERKIEG